MKDQTQPKTPQEKIGSKPLSKLEEYQRLWEQMLQGTDIRIRRIKGKAVYSSIF